MWLDRKIMLQNRIRDHLSCSLVKVHIASSTVEDDVASLLQLLGRLAVHGDTR